MTSEGGKELNININVNEESIIRSIQENNLFINVNFSSFLYEI